MIGTPLPVFTVDRRALASALSLAVRGLPARSGPATAGCVVLRATGDTVEVCGSDGDIDIRMRVPARVEASGAAAVSADALLSLLKKSSAASLGAAPVPAPESARLLTRREDEADRRWKVRWESNPETRGRPMQPRPPLPEAVILRLSIGRSRVDLFSLDPESYPQRAADALTSAFSSGGDALADAIEATGTAVSREKTTVWLHGVHVAAHPDGVSCTATDRIHLHRDIVPAGAIPGGMSAILPSGTMTLLAEACRGRETVSLEIGSAGGRLVTPVATIAFPLVAGTFPNADKILSGKRGTVARVDRDALAQALDRVSTILQDPKFRPVRVEIYPGALTVRALPRPTDQGTAEEEIDADTDGGITATVLAPCLAQALDLFQGDVLISHDTESGGAPLVITGASGGPRIALLHVRGD